MRIMYMYNVRDTRGRIKLGYLAASGLMQLPKDLPVSFAISSLVETRGERWNPLKM